jgi:energy-coupling factor transporter ATP-binding protein EcfA2
MHKNKKSNTNLLIFDEVMSGLDLYGTTALFDILKDHKDYQNKCIITINHNTDLDDAYFDHMYEVISESGFSKIVELQ